MTTLVGTSTASATTVTIPAHQAGDEIIIEAVRGATTFATLPAGWTNILTKASTSGSPVSMRLGYKTATSTSDTSGTWTNAAELVCHVYRPGAGKRLAIGASASNTSATNTVDYPALSLTKTDGTSWIAGFVACANTSETIATAPTGMTNESTVAGATYAAAGHDTEGPVSSWSDQAVVTTGTAAKSVSATVEIVELGADSTPTQMVQHIGGGGNPYTRGNTGGSAASPFLLPWTNYVGVGNCLVLAISYDSGTSVSSISDNIDGTWPASSVFANGGGSSSGNLDAAIYVLPNASSDGTTQRVISVKFGAAVRVFQYKMSEFYNIATSSPVVGSSSSANAVSLSAGSFTPSVSGSIIWSYHAKSGGSNVPGSLVSEIIASSPMTLLDADIGWANANDSMTAVTAAYYQTAAAAVNPTINVPGNADTWNCLAVALKVDASKGTAPASGIRIAKVLHFATEHWPGSGAFSLICPSMGNLRMICSDDPSLNSITVTDSEGNTWSDDGISQATGIWYLKNAAANANLKVTLTGGGADNNLSWRYCDIVGAHSSPYAGATHNLQTVNSVSTFTASPSPSPTSAPGITICNIGLGAGPGLGVTAPTGARWLLCTYPTLETDFDLIENADIMAWTPYAATGAQTWTFSITNNASNSTSGGFISFLPAPAAAPAGPMLKSLRPTTMILRR